MDRVYNGRVFRNDAVDGLYCTKSLEMFRFEKRDGPIRSVWNAGDFLNNHILCMRAIPLFQKQQGIEW